MLKTYAIDTLGCKVNQYESRQMKLLLEQLGLTTTVSAEKPDIVIVNTCCVTHIASAKSRQYIRKALKNSIVVVVGCLTAAPADELRDLGENIYLIKNRSNLVTELSRIALGQSPSKRHNQGLDIKDPSSTIKTQNSPKIKDKNPPKPPKLPDLTEFSNQTRAFLKVQDGCDSYCTYCIIPKVRPDIQNRDIKSILNEAQNLVEAGHKEIVLTGINLGAYGRETTKRRLWQNNGQDYLPELVAELAKVPGLARIRLSSLNPQDISEQLLAVFVKNKNILPHLHLSLQSGSSSVLKRMARQYTANDYLEKVEMIKDRLKAPAITTDIIVGFVGETDSEFKETLDFAKEVGFSRIHVFSYSKRAGTAAAKMKPHIKPQVIKSRAAELQELADDLAYDFRQQFIGKTAEVLVENIKDGFAIGRAERYFQVKIENPPENLAKGQIIKTKLIKNQKDHAISIPV